MTDLQTALLIFAIGMGVASAIGCLGLILVPMDAYDNIPRLPPPEA